MFHLEIELENDSSIEDVLLCWGSGNASDQNSTINDDDDFIISNWKELEDLHGVVINDSSETWDPTSSGGRHLLLEELKKKYPSFIPPPLPEVPIQRPHRPLCIFVNFMGTRQGSPKPGMLDISKRKRVELPLELPITGSPYPTLLPSCSPVKRTKVNPSPSMMTELPLVSPTMSPTTHARPIMQKSPLPARSATRRISTPILCEYYCRSYLSEASHSFPHIPVVGSPYHF